MAQRTTLNVSLTPELERFVNERVASGRYQTASEVIRDALRLLEERHHEREAALAEVRRKIAEGIEAADLGDLHDPEEVFAELRQRLTKRRKKSA